MGRKAYYFVTFLFLLIGHRGLLAQNLSVSGSVLDSINRQPLIGAAVQLNNRADTTQQYVASVDLQGNFSFLNVKPATYRLRVSYLGYQPLSRFISLQQNTDLGSLLLSIKAEVLGPVEVVGKVPLAVQKGDTTEMNARAFKVNRDATAEDLITKMPGITNTNGTIQAQGENVGKVLVDGKEFFGDDASIALKNLPAEVIDKIQVFDRQSDQAQFSGFDDGNTTKTLNIVTRADRRNGQFGKVYAGYGTQDRYLAGGNVNLFQGDRKISIIGLTNNLNQQNFSNQDLLGISSASGGGRGGNAAGGGGRGGQGGNRGGGSSANNFMVGQQNGITTTHSLGINYSDEWGKKLTVNGSYFFNGTENVNNQAVERTYFLAENASQLYNQNSVTESRNQNHRLSFRIEYKIDSTNSLLITPRLNFQNNTSTRNQLQHTSVEERLLSHSENTNQSNHSGYTFANDLLFRHRFVKRGRSFSINLNTQANNRTGETNLLALNQYYGSDAIENDSLNHHTPNRTNGYSLSSNVAYTEPVGKNAQVQAEYNLSYSHNFADRKTYLGNNSLSEQVRLDTTLSNTTDNDYLTNRGGISYRYTKSRQLMLSLGASFQSARLMNERTFPADYSLQRTFNNLLPNFMFRYNFDPNKNLRLMYRTSTNAPSVSQLQEVLDQTNSLLQNIGNAQLKQEYAHNLTFRYNSNNPGKATSFFALLSVSQTQNYISYSTLLAQQDTVMVYGNTLRKGEQLSQPVNLNGYWNARSYLVYGVPVTKLKVNLNFNTGFTYAHTPSLINGQKNTSDSYVVSQGVVVSSNISEKVNFTLSYNANYNIVQNTIQPTLNNNYFYQTTGLKTNIQFLKNFVWQNEVNHTWYTGLASGFNQEFLLWNMSVGKKFLKNQTGELKLTAFDLLNQNNSISRNVTETYVEDVRTRVLNRYFLVTFTYTLRNFKQSK